MRVDWMRCHVAVRNGRGSISTSFAEPDYSIELIDRLFYVKAKDKLVTTIPVENVVEFSSNFITTELCSGEEKARAVSKRKA